MTTPQSPSAKERVIAFVRAACPESMELKRGCRVKLPKQYDNDILTFCSSDKYMIDGRLEETISILSENDCHNELYGEDIEEMEILGRPLTLQDCALAIQDGGSSFLHDCPDGGSPVAVTLFDLYNLSEDFYSQKPPFYEFVSSLISNV